MPPKAPLTVKEFLFLLATDPKALARYNDPKKRARLLALYLSPENRRLLSQPDAIQIRYSIELEARAADAEVEVTSASPPIYSPPIYPPTGMPPIYAAPEE